MVEFKVENSELDLELGEWSKHHEFVGRIIQREYLDSDKETSSQSNELFLKEIATGVNIKTKIHSNAYDRVSGARLKIKDSYLIYKNTESTLPLQTYDDCFGDSKRETKIKYKFMFDDYVFYLDQVCTFSGSYPLLDWVDEDVLEALIDEITESDDIEKYGIIKNEDEYSFYVVSSLTGNMTTLDMSMCELLEGLVGFEVYESKVTYEGGE